MKLHPTLIALMTILFSVSCDQSGAKDNTLSTTITVPDGTVFQLGDKKVYPAKAALQLIFTNQMPTKLVLNTEMIRSELFKAGSLAIPPIAAMDLVKMDPFKPIEVIFIAKQKLINVVKTGFGEAKSIEKITRQAEFYNLQNYRLESYKQI